MTEKFKFALWTAIGSALGIGYEAVTDETTLTVAQCTESTAKALAETTVCEGHVTISGEWSGDADDPNRYKRFVRMSKNGDTTLTGPVRPEGYPKWEENEMEPAESEPAPEFEAEKESEPAPDPKATAPEESK